MAVTVGYPDGDAWADVAFANAYFGARAVTAWAGSDDVKIGALVRATDYVKALFAARFDPELFELTVPVELQKAVSEYALIDLASPGSLAPAPQVDASGFAVIKTKQKIGPLERDYAAVGASTGRPMLRRFYPIPDALIAALLLPTLTTNRVVR